MISHPLAGVYVAAVTPLNQDYSPDLDAIPLLLDFLARRGCDGALLLGTTGEGPSFSTQERADIWKQATEIKADYPDFKLLAGTGTPSMSETIGLTRTAFNLGYDGVVVLPPYYFMNAKQAGLYQWYCELISRGVPSDGQVLGYHIPQVAGVGITIELLHKLRDKFPDQFIGVKDSSGDINHTQSIITELGPEFLTLVGNDKIFSRALKAGAQGCITALANLHSQELKNVWAASKRRETDEFSQNTLNLARDILDRFPPATATIKSLLNDLHGIPKWAVRPPLLSLPQADEKRLLQEMTRASIR